MCPFQMFCYINPYTISKFTPAKFISKAATSQGPTEYKLTREWGHPQHPAPRCSHWAQPSSMVKLWASLYFLYWGLSPTPQPGLEPSEESEPLGQQVSPLGFPLLGSCAFLVIA